MSHLRKKHRLSVDVKKWDYIFVKCTICESLKDLISKVGKNSTSAKEHETKLQKHNIHRESCICFYHTWKIESIQSKENIFVSSMTRWTTPKLFFQDFL